MGQVCYYFNIAGSAKKPFESKGRKRFFNRVSSTEGYKEIKYAHDDSGTI
jgi:hypothetical protein